MSRYRINLPLERESEIKNRLIRTCGVSEMAMFLDSHEHHDTYSRFKWLAGFESLESLSSSENSLKKLEQFQSSKKDWMLGHLSFELKNEIEQLSSSNPDKLGYPHLNFFIPKYVIYHDGERIWLETLEEIKADDFLDLLEPQPAPGAYTARKISLECQTSLHAYREKARELLQELQLGNIYEINYCIEFSAEDKLDDPAESFIELNLHTEAPFTAFYKLRDKYLLSASPERYLQKRSNRIISQPMKGTSRRDPDPIKDDQLKAALYQSEKERSENVMITDLVRNDLSKIASVGSVKVEELFGIYTYKSVHQMLSTISCEVEGSEGIEKIISATFPMGSMTGAPKVSALNLIDRHESFQRGLYSGSVGYLTPDGDMDLNVVIRSLLYNSSKAYISARVGSAITIHSEADKEYEECLIKVESLLKALHK